MKTISYENSAASKLTQKRRAVVFGITNDLCFAVGTMLIGFLKHNPNFDGTVLIFHESLSEDQMANLVSVYPTISFRSFTRENVENRLSKSANRQVIERLISRYSIFYFAKFELPDLLNEFERVIWFDVDMLVRGSLETLWDFEEFTWRPVGPASKLPKSFLDLFEKEIKTKAYNRPNGGLIGICRDVRHRGNVTSARLYHWFNEMQTRGRSLIADEFSYFLFASAIDAKVKGLSPSFNCISTRRGCDTAKIIHAIGANKFWNCASMKLAYPDWQIWHNEWVQNGGDTFDGSVSKSSLFVSTPNQLVEASLYQGIWADFYAQIMDVLPPGVIPDIQTHRHFWQLFIQKWPREQVHIEVARVGKSFSVALRINGAAAQDNSLVERIDEIFFTSGGYEKVSTKIGVSWEQIAIEVNVPELIVECAVLTSELNRSM